MVIYYQLKYSTDSKKRHREKQILMFRLKPIVYEGFERTLRMTVFVCCFRDTTMHAAIERNSWRLPPEDIVQVADPRSKKGTVRNLTRSTVLVRLNKCELV